MSSLSRGGFKRRRGILSEIESDVDQIENEVDDIYSTGTHNLKGSGDVYKLHKEEGGTFRQILSTADDSEVGLYLRKPTLENNSGTHGLKLGIDANTGNCFVNNQYGSILKFGVDNGNRLQITDKNITLQNDTTLCGADKDEVGRLIGVTDNIQTQLDDKQTQLNAKMPFQGGDHTIEVLTPENYYKPKFENSNKGIAVYYRSTHATAPASCFTYYQNNNTGLGASQGLNAEHVQGLKVGVTDSGIGQLVMHGVDKDFQICTSVSATDRSPDPVMTFNGGGTVIMETGKTFCGATNDEIGYLSGLTGNIENRLGQISTFNTTLTTHLNWQSTWRSPTFYKVQLHDVDSTSILGSCYMAPADMTVASVAISILNTTSTNTRHRFVLKFHVNGVQIGTMGYVIGITTTSNHYIQHFDDLNNIHTAGYQDLSFSVTLNKNDAFQVSVTESSSIWNNANDTWLSSGEDVIIRVLLK